MAGYEGFSKSNNAVEAEERGLYPASIAAKKLGVSTEAIKATLLPSEWHHTSSHYNVTDYYDINVDDEEMAALKAFKVEKVDVLEFTADVEWIEWSGTRNHPKAVKHTHTGIFVTQKGKFYTFHLATGDVRKQIGSRGTIVRKYFLTKV